MHILQNVRPIFNKYIDRTRHIRRISFFPKTFSLNFTCGGKKLILSSFKAQLAPG